jgi:Ca-activated chloride channel homolog
VTHTKRNLTFAVSFLFSLGAVITFLLISGINCTMTSQDQKTSDEQPISSAPVDSKEESDSTAADGHLIRRDVSISEPTTRPETFTFNVASESKKTENRMNLNESSISYGDKITYPGQDSKFEDQTDWLSITERRRKPSSGGESIGFNFREYNGQVGYDTDGDGIADSWGFEYGGRSGMGGRGMGGGMGGMGTSSGSRSSFGTLGGYGRPAGTSEEIRKRYLQEGESWYRTHPAKTRHSSLIVTAPQATRYPEDLAYVMADEVWVICKPETPPVAPPKDAPGSGCLMARLPDQEKEIPLPLKHTDVQAHITGYIASVDVTQQFHNPYETKIEAVYVFPLPQNAAVNDFIMTIGDRKIRGIIRERQQAERIYQTAKRQGYEVALLTQERPNIFTQKVANIEPKKQIDINIHYFNTLAYVDGWYEFVFPMVVGPRFNPPGFTDGVGAVARGKTGISGQQTEVQYLKPSERSGHDIAVTVNLDAGVSIEKLKSTNHVITKESPKPEQAVVKLNSLDTVPNKDFVLRYKVAGKRLKSAFVTHRDERGGFFTLMLYPPEQTKHVKRAPMEMVFLLDCSGSMNGKPIAKAKNAINRALLSLQEGDTFQVIRFSNNASQFGPKPIPATKENIRKAVEYVEKLKGSGGTIMIEGIKAALDFPHDPERFRFVCFMTDGYIGNEAQILAETHNRLGDSRIFSFGVGKSVNRFLIDRLAKLGKGAVAYISLNDDATDIVDNFYERIKYPALTDIEIDFGAMQVAEVYPKRIPDLFVGRPIIITGRFRGDGNTTVKVNGKIAGKDYQQEFNLDLEDPAAKHDGLAFVWARKKIEQLSLIENISARNPSIAAELPGMIKDVALEYSLMSKYTAFVAVDSSRRTEGDHGVTVNVPVPVPDGVKYETTVQSN